MNDLKLSFRRLLKTPGFTVVAMLTMALCIGANLTIFAVVDAILVRSLPFPEAERLVNVYNSYPKAGAERSEASVPNYFDRREGISAFESVSLYQDATSTIGGEGSPRRIDSARVTPDFFATLKQPLAMGQAFVEVEMDYGSDRVTIITDAFWRNHFNADPEVIGKTFTLNSAPAIVKGVLPPDFRYLDSKAKIFRPLTHAPEVRAPDNRHSNIADMVARLAPGVSLAEAQAQMDAFNAHQLTDDPLAEGITNGGYHTKVVPLHTDHVREVKPVLVLLQVGVFFLFLIGAFNLTNLLLVRASGRFKEFAVRQALGASRRHQARGVLIETVLLTFGGGILGVVFAAIGIQFMQTLGADKLPLGTAISFEGRLMGLALLGSVIVGACLACPIIAFNRFYGERPSHLQSESRSGTAVLGIQRLRSGFSIVQVALAFVLLAGAGLLGISLKRVLSTAPGFESDQVLTGHLSLPWKNYQGQEPRLAFVQRLLPAVNVLPGVTNVAVSDALPFTDEATGGDNVIFPEGYTPSTDGSLRAHYLSYVSKDYWKVMGIPLLDGRFLTDADIGTGKQVAVVDAALAKRYWPAGDAVGRRFCRNSDFSEENAFTIVGVVGNVKQTDLVEEDGHGAAYFPLSMSLASSYRLLVRTASDPSAAGPMVHKAILKLDPELPLADVRTMKAHIEESLTLRRSPTILASLFAAVALVLAAIGIYGVLAHAVSQRRREIGVRMAVGALPSQIRQQFLMMGVRLLVFGALVGLVGTWATGRAMQGILFGVPALHWPTILGALLLITIVTVMACLLPSTRAARVPPTEALR